MQKSKIQLKNKKSKELEYANFFIERFNKHYNLDYEAQPNEKEDKGVDPEIDIYGISNSQSILKFQIVTREQILREIEPRLVHNPGKPICIISLDIKNWISKAIQLKENKKYSNQKELTLLISGDISPLFNKDCVKRIFAKFRNSGFKGIYSLHLPSTSGNSGHPHNGQVIAIKDIFGDHGVIF